LLLYHKRRREKGVEGERKKKSGRRLPPVLPLIDSGTVFVFLESQMHITPLPLNLLLIKRCRQIYDTDAGVSQSQSSL
jgi:hypothetical protein